MYNQNKADEIVTLCNSIINTIKAYEENGYKVYFDYDRVSELLTKATSHIIDTARCPRPDNIPPNMPWSERLYDGTEFDLCAYDGSMSADDFERASAAYRDDKDESEDMER